MSKPKGHSSVSGIEDVRAKQVGTCPVCGKDGKLDIRRKPSGRGWWVQCWVCDEGSAYLADLAAAVGCRPYQLIDDPLTHLGHLLERPTSGSAARQESVTGAHIDGWCSRLTTTEHALAWLHRRGLTDETIRRYLLGYDGDAHAITIPVYDEAGELVNLRRRFLAPDADPKIVGLVGRGRSHLYPLSTLDSDPAALVLCEGEPDCWLLNQHGIPALTSTAGTTWKPEWDAHVVGRRVGVLYDAGALSYERAERRALALVAAGAGEAWPVDLTLAGFAKGEDVTDWFVTYGWDATALKAFLNASRKWFRADSRAVA